MIILKKARAPDTLPEDGLWWYDKRKQMGYQNREPDK